jgi:hypothetical protein
MGRRPRGAHQSGGQDRAGARRPRPGGNHRGRGRSHHGKPPGRPGAGSIANSIAKLPIRRGAGRGVTLEGAAGRRYPFLSRFERKAGVTIPPVFGPAPPGSPPDRVTFHRLGLVAGLMPTSMPTIRHSRGLRRGPVLSLHFPLLPVKPAGVELPVDCLIPGKPAVSSPRRRGAGPRGQGSPPPIAKTQNSYLKPRARGLRSGSQSAQVISGPMPSLTIALSIARYGSPGGDQGGA